MKITKRQLKQIIKEELKNAGLVLETRQGFDVENPDPAFTASPVWWKTITDATSKRLLEIYRQAPPPGKEYMTKVFEAVVQKWKKEQAAGSEEELVGVGGGQLAPKSREMHYRGQGE